MSKIRSFDFCFKIDYPKNLFSQSFHHLLLLHKTPPNLYISFPPHLLARKTELQPSLTDESAAITIKIYAISCRVVFAAVACSELLFEGWRRVEKICLRVTRCQR